jgi:ABC-2 type transport system ATP-binding protein
MIDVKDLVKRFGEKEAVSHVSFHVGRGEIVGFLGPTGAGKTTTMRMITGFLPATSGEVTVGSVPVSADTKEVRRQIGYLPENNPLYEDLRVREYLRFRADLKAIPRKVRAARIDEVMAACEVTEVADRIIGTCSKGFRQRVGLADALLANPPVLILDEPTVGLDPVQIVRTRELVKDLSRDHTVVLSTHILPEVEAICSRALILHQGRLLFDGPVSDLHQSLGGGSVTVCTVAAEAAVTEPCLASVEGVERVEFIGAPDGGSTFRVLAEAGADVRAPLSKALAEAGLPLLEMKGEQISLEEAFLSITTRDHSPEVSE